MDPMENAPGAHIKAMGQAAVDVAKEGFAGPGKLHEMAYEGGSMEREAK